MWKRGQSDQQDPAITMASLTCANSVPVVWSAVLALAAPRQVPVALLLERRVAKIQIDAVADGPGMGRAYVH